MIGILAGITFALNVQTSAAIRLDSTSPRPVVAFFLHFAFDWGGLETTGTPLFVLYDDGLLIYCLQRTDQGIRFDSVALSPGELSHLKDSLGLELGFFQLKDGYNNLPNVTDMPIYIIQAWHGDSSKRVMVVGTFDTSETVVRLSHTNPLAATPAPFLRAYTIVSRYRHPRAREWKPTRFEAVISDFPGTDTSPIHWPANWPGLAAAKRDSLGNYHVVFNGNQFREFLRRYSRLVNERPFLIDNGNRFVRVRVVFPGEVNWIN